MWGQARRSVGSTRTNYAVNAVTKVTARTVRTLMGRAQVQAANARIVRAGHLATHWNSDEPGHACADWKWTRDERVEIDLIDSEDVRHSNIPTVIR